MPWAPPKPTIQQQGKDRIVVQLPGMQDPDQVKDVIGRTAKLTFQLLCEAQPTGTRARTRRRSARRLPLKESRSRSSGSRHRAAPPSTAPT